MLRFGRFPKSDNSITSRSSNRVSPKFGSGNLALGPWCDHGVNPLTRIVPAHSLSHEHHLFPAARQDDMKLMGYNEAYARARGERAEARPRRHGSR